jgi:2-polyprenyl-3-methyl-5-hydroxy-6-metoxy-1,4-benzoquinol methylase
LSEEIREFYDDYVSKQKKKGINIRHRSILKQCKKAGLRSDSRVLEIGCGIGTLTQLLGKFCKRGSVLGVDISPESINQAKIWSSKMPHVSFAVSDMSDFSVGEKFDFVIFPDVLEHIPIEQHSNLFRVIEKHSHSNTTICIHIPNPPYLRYFIKNKPEVLQIIDQPLDTSVLMGALYAADFCVESIRTYSLSTLEHDYQFMVFRKGLNREYTQINSKPLFQKVMDEFLSRLT